MRLQIWTAALATLGVLVGCASPPSAQPRPSDPSASPPSSAVPKTLTVAYESEPLNLVLPFAGQNGSRGGSELHLAVHQRLATYDERGGLHPMLASELPARDAGSWVVRPDGTMQTTYRLRPNVTWHDRTALTARDLAFAWTLSADPEIPVAQRKISELIARIDTPDALTVAIEWKAAYPFAAALTEDDLGPLPTHLLEALYMTDKERLVQSSYWSHEFVGVGPFRLTGWEAGSHLVLKAYEGFYAGRAKLDTLIVRFIDDDTTAVAQMLAGTLDGDVSETIQFGQAMFVKREWERAGRTPVVFVQPTKWRFLFVQFRNTNPQEILDVRVRRGLLHAIDRKELGDVLLEGQVDISDSMIPPTDPKWEWVKDVVTRYDYAPRTAERLLAEVGWRRGADGAVANPAGQRVTVPAWTQPGEMNAQELAVIADYWKALGLAVDQTILAMAQVRDPRHFSSFPGVLAAQAPLTFANVTTRAHGPNCPTEAVRWAGTSRGCYQNAEMDRVIEGLKTTIEPSEQRGLWRDLIRIQSQELPVLPLYFNVTVTTFSGRGHRRERAHGTEDRRHLERCGMGRAIEGFAANGAIDPTRFTA